MARPKTDKPVGRPKKEHKNKPLTKVVRCPIGYEQYVALLPDMMNLMIDYKTRADIISPRWEQLREFIEEMEELIEIEL